MDLLKSNQDQVSIKTMEAKEIKNNVPEGYEIDPKKYRKDLLLKDLCARLPYGVFVKDKYIGHDGKMYKINQGCVYYVSEVNCSHRQSHPRCIKPYLRPMSSMTEEEKQNLLRAWNIKASFVGSRCDAIVSDNTWWGGKDKSEPLGFDSIPFKYMSAVIDWLDEHHFDYRGLIEKGLALEAKEGMYK